MIQINFLDNLIIYTDYNIQIHCNASSTLKRPKFVQNPIQNAGDYIITVQASSSYHNVSSIIITWEKLRTISHIPSVLAYLANAYMITLLAKIQKNTYRHFVFTKIISLWLPQLFCPLNFQKKNLSIKFNIPKCIKLKKFQHHQQTTVLHKQQPIQII